MEAFLKEPLRNKVKETFFPVNSLLELKEKVKNLGYEISAEKTEKGIVSFYGFKGRTFVKYIMFFYIEKTNKVAIIANLSPEPNNILLISISNFEDENLEKLEEITHKKEYSRITIDLSHSKSVFGSSETYWDKSYEQSRLGICLKDAEESIYRRELLFPYAIFENILSSGKRKSFGTLLLVSLHKYFVTNYGDLKSITTISQKKRESMAENIVIDFFKRNFFSKMYFPAYGGYKSARPIDFYRKKDRSFLEEIFVSRYVQKEFFGKYSYSSEELFLFFNNFIKNNFWHLMKKIAKEYPKNKAKVLRGKLIELSLSSYEDGKVFFGKDGKSYFKSFLSEVILLAEKELENGNINPFVTIKEHNEGMLTLIEEQVLDDEFEEEVDIPF